jgi:hypothetical protein
MNKKRSEIRTTHVVFLRDEPMREILAGRKGYEFRLSFGRLACEVVREGDLLLLKRVGGEVEAACDVGEVLIYTDLRPDEVADLARRYGGETSRPYLLRYAPPRNLDRAVNAAIVEMLNVRPASLPCAVTPRGVRSGWVADFGGHAAHMEPW